VVHEETDGGGDYEDVEDDDDEDENESEEDDNDLERVDYGDIFDDDITREMLE
jgi:hypothetical protein